jgi:hypothetical protein
MIKKVVNQQSNRQAISYSVITFVELTGVCSLPLRSVVPALVPILKQAGSMEAAPPLGLQCTNPRTDLI